MGTSKTDQFNEHQNKMANALKALAHPARIAIIEYLLSVDTCICGDIVNELPLAQPTVSQHLRELKNAGLIKGTIEGKGICYCVNDEAIAELKAYFSNIQQNLNTKKCC